MTEAHNFLMIRWLWIYVSVLCACSTSGERRGGDQDLGAIGGHTPRSKPTKKPLNPMPPERLQFELRMEREPEDLGYSEKTFDACKMGYVDPDEGCPQYSFAVIHFRLQCRDSTGTVQEAVTAAELVPVVSDRIVWSLGAASGVTRTNRNGFGQIRAVTARSAAAQRLMLKNGTQYLGQTANEVSRLVVPKNWCEN